MNVIQELFELQKSLSKRSTNKIHRLLQRPEARQEVEVWAQEVWEIDSCLGCGYLEICYEILKYPKLRATLPLWGGEALCIAVEKGNLPLVCELLQDPEIRRQAWLSPAWYVALRSTYRHPCIGAEIFEPFMRNEILKELENAPRTSAQGEHSRYPGYSLCEAVARGKIEELRTLLQDPTQAEAWGSHALYYMASQALHFMPRQEYTEIKILLEDPHIRAQAHIGQNAALRAAAKNDASAIVLELLRHDNVRREAHAAKNEALRWAVANADSESVLALLTIEKVRQNAHLLNNQALRKAITKAHAEEISMLRWAAPHAAHGDNESVNHALREIIEKRPLGEAAKNEIHAAENEALRWAAANADSSDSVRASLTIEEGRQNAPVLTNQALRKAMIEAYAAEVIEKPVREHPDALIIKPTLRKAFKKEGEKVVFYLLTLKNVQEALSPEEWQDPMIQRAIEQYNLLLFLKAAQDRPLELLREILTFLPTGQPYLDLKKNERYVERLLLYSKKMFAATKALPAPHRGKQEEGQGSPAKKRGLFLPSAS